MPDPLPNSEVLQSLVERFHKAKWISGVSLVTSEPFEMMFTRLGEFRMREIVSLAAERLEMDRFPEVVGFARETAINNQFAALLAELQPPPLTEQESDLLVALAHYWLSRQ